MRPVKGGSPTPENRIQEQERNEMSQDVDQVFEGTTRPLPRMRRTAARRLAEAWTAPVIHLAREVDMTRMLEAHDREKGVTVTDALLQACARAVNGHPKM